MAMNGFYGHLFYRPQTKFGAKVIFSEACVKNSVHRGVSAPGGCLVWGVCSQGLTGVRPWAVGANMEFNYVFGKGGKHALWVLLLTEW